MTLDARVRVDLGGFVVDAELQAAAGELVALVGPNGAGKTTLLRALAGLRPVDAGSVRIDGRVVDDVATNTFVAPESRSVGVVFQDYLLFPHMSVVDNVAFGLREQGARKRAAREVAREWLDRVGLADKSDARPASLSGGEAQRVALVRAVVTEPALLLLDEPFAALDVQQRAEVRHDLRGILDGFAGVQVVVTHDAVDALTIADRIVVMEHGAIVQDGTPDAIVARPRSQYVAELVGVNLYRGRAIGSEIVLDAGGSITVADMYHGPVFVTVAPRAVTLHRTAPTDGTARNVWPGAITGTERVGDRVRVRVGGAISVVAEVTAAAVDALQLRDGAEVWATVKATEIDVHPE